MKSLNNMFKNIKSIEIILGIIIIFYIFGDYQTPHEISPFITNIISYIVMLCIVFVSLSNTSIIFSLLLTISFLILINRSHKTHPTNVMPSQANRDTIINNLNSANNNNNAPTNNLELEEYMVKNISTINHKQIAEDNEVKPFISTNTNIHEL